MNTTGVVIARFQTPYLHEGHHHLIQSVMALHKNTVIVLGISAAKGSRRNPFDFETRVCMLRAAYPLLTILPLRDQASDELWSLQLDTLLADSCPGNNFLLYGSRDSFADLYSGQWPVAQVAAKEQYCATTIRNSHGSQVLETQDFRMGINYACQHRYEAVYPTVDVALLNADKTRLLLGRKPTEETWRLPGGFAGTEDRSYEEAAARELAEECGDLQTTTFQYLGSYQIDDWRYRTEQDKIMTLLFTTQLVTGTPRAGDDLAEVQWFDVALLPGMITEQRINASHHPLFTFIFNYLNK